MRTIKLVKILDYERKPLTGSEFVHTRNLLMQKVNPPTLHPKKLSLREPILFCSKLKRARTCIITHIGQRYITTSLLNEIPFDLAKGCTVLEFRRDGSSAVRRTFKELFIADTLEMKRATIFKQIRKILAATHAHHHKEYTFISHSFRMKLIEAYIKTGGQIEQKPELIHKYILDDKKTFDFGKGISLNVNKLRRL
jgi:hypothetical protein